MNDNEKRFREMLSDLPFDATPRSEHLDSLRELVLGAFDEASAEASLVKVELREPSQRRSTRRPVVWKSLTAVVAASVLGVLAALHGSFDDASAPNRSPTEQSHALTAADQNLVAALSQLSEYDEENVASTFDLGIQVCLVEFDLNSSRFGSKESGSTNHGE